MPLLQALTVEGRGAPGPLLAARDILSASAIWLAACERDGLSCVASVGLEEDLERAFREHPGAFCRCAADLQSATGPVSCESLGRPHVSIPVRSGGVTLGMVGVGLPDGRPQPEPALLEGIASLFALAMEVDGAHGEVRLADDPGRDVMSRYSASLLGELDPGRIADLCTRTIRSALRADCATVRVPDPTGAYLVLQSIEGAARQQSRGSWPIPLDEPTNILAVAARERRVRICEDFGKGPYSVPRDAADLALRSGVAVPLIVGERVLGALAAFSRTPDVHGPREIALLTLIADQTALALDRADIFAARTREIEALKMTRARAEEQASELRALYGATLSVLGGALELRDTATGGHTERVVGLALALGEALGLSQGELLGLRWGAYLHDIGKIGIPDAILKKPGPLEPGERALMESHPVLGHHLLERLTFLSSALDVVLHHHEKWDGSGYPSAMRGEEIPLLARIFAVADAYDAMTTVRPYRGPFTHRKAREEIARFKGVQFDPRVADALLGLTQTRLLGALEGPPPIASGKREPTLSANIDVESGASILSLVGSLITAASLDSTLKSILGELEDLFDAPISSILMLDPDSENLYFVAMHGYDPELVERVRVSIRDEVSIVAWVARNGRPYYAPNVRLDPMYLKGSEKIWSEAAFPLLVDGEVIGVMNIESDRVDAFPGPVRTVMEAFAALASLAIHRVHREEQLMDLAHTDPLTGLANRRAVWDGMERELSRFHRRGDPFSLIVVEVDRFKSVNDRYGHLHGDEVLKEIAACLRRSSRQLDLVGRTGGDEFVIVLPQTGRELAVKVARRILTEVPLGPLASDAGVTISLGVSSLPEDATTVDELYDTADQVMYRVKRQGGNGVRSFRTPVGSRQQ